MVQIPTSSPQLNLMVQRPTAPGQFHMWKNADVYPGQMYSSPLLWTQCYRVVLHHVSLICDRMLQSCTTPGQIYRCTPHYDMWKNADVNRSDITPQPPLIKPHATEPYYTRSVSHVEECRCTQVRCTAPANQIQCYYRALLHHVSLTCGRMETYPDQTYIPH